MSNAKPLPPDFSKVFLAEAIFVESSIKNPKKIFDKSLIDAFKTEFSLQPTFNVQNKSVKVDIKLHCTAFDEKEEPTGIEGKFHLEFTFVVEEMENHLVKSKNSERLVPVREIMIPLAGTAYSTARGMIIMKVLGTPLEGFSLPIVNAQELFAKRQEGIKKESSKPKEPKLDA